MQHRRCFWIAISTFELSSVGTFLGVNCAIHKCYIFALYNNVWSYHESNISFENFKITYMGIFARNSDPPSFIESHILNEKTLYAFNTVLFWRLEKNNFEIKIIGSLLIECANQLFNKTGYLSYLLGFFNYYLCQVMHIWPIVFI